MRNLVNEFKNYSTGKKFMVLMVITFAATLPFEAMESAKKRREAEAQWAKMTPEEKKAATMEQMCLMDPQLCKDYQAAILEMHKTLEKARPHQ